MVKILKDYGWKLNVAIPAIVIRCLIQVFVQEYIATGRTMVIVCPGLDSPGMWIHAYSCVVAFTSTLKRESRILL